VKSCLSRIAASVPPISDALANRANVSSIAGHVTSSAGFVSTARNVSQSKRAELEARQAAENTDREIHNINAVIKLAGAATVME
jgi:hypothetical protein